jgi:hypothetical protein
MSSTAGPPTLQLRVRLNLDGLVPDPHEFDPSLAHHATFGTGRLPSKVPLTAAQQTGQEDIVLSDYALPSLQELRGDEHILFNVITKSRLSGMSELDATDHDYVTRDSLSGSVALPLFTLLHSAAVDRPFRLSIEEPSIYDSLRSDNAAKVFGTLDGHSEDEVNQALAVADANARFGATKGRIESLRAIVTPPSAATAYATKLRELVRASEADPEQPLLLGTERWKQAVAHNEAINMQHYGRHFLNNTRRGQPALFPNALDKSCNALQMPFFTSDFGSTLPVTYFAPRNHPRLQAPGTTLARDALYGETDATLQFYARAARSAFASVGLSEAGAARALDEQLRSSKADALLPLSPRLIEGTAHTLQAFGNNMKYRSDLRTPNRAYLAEQRGTKRCYACAQKARTMRALLAHGFGVNEGTEETGGVGGVGDIEMSGENMNDKTQSNLVNSDDCEDMWHPAQAAHFEILPLDRALALNPARLAKYPLLNAMARVLERYDVLDLGVSATTPYLDASAADKSASATEAKVEYNGHIHGRGMARVLVADMVERGNDGYDVRARVPEYFDRLDADGRVTREIAPFEAILPSFNIEGTSPGAVFIQPAAELNAHWAASTRACHNVYASVALLGAPENAPRDYLSTLGRTFSAKQLPRHLNTPTDPKARISDFYHADIHAVSPRLFAHDARLAHFNFVDMRNRARGVTVDRLMRARPGDPDSTIALVSPFMQTSDEEMQTLVDVAAVIKNTQPASAMAHFPPVDRAAQPHSVVADLPTALLRLGHPLSDATFAALTHLKVPKFPQAQVWSAFTRALDNHSRGQQQFRARFGASPSAPGVSPAGIEKIAHHLDRTDRTVYSMFAPAWAVANADMGALDREIKELYAKGLIIDHAFWRDRFLQQCDDQITMALVVPVAST